MSSPRVVTADQTKALIEQGEDDIAEAEELKQKLVDHFGENHPLLLECERLIRLQSFRATLQAKKPASPRDGGS